LAENIVDEYGWVSAAPTCAAGFITPVILEILIQLGVQKVVDVGAGNGALCAVLANAGFVCVGIECDQTGVSIAREAHPEIPFHRAGIQDDPGAITSAEGLFDAAVSTEVIEHLFSPYLLPVFARKLLKPDGHLIITTPYHGYLKNLALSLADKWDDHHSPLWNGGHIKFWSRQTLSRLLTEQGFDVVSFHGIGRAPYVWKSMALVARKRQVPSGADSGAVHATR
jgi:2-polyprenyl-3-methyl-5-hydroxy-6-metoxy-1,4-benzoquinol methylase